MSLNNLSNRQADTGDRAGALATISEAVDIRRTLARANPAAYLPDLASSLNNLSNRQADTGDRAGALATITEAVYIRRTLAQANPAAYLPDLAMSLNNLGRRMAESDRTEDEAAIWQQAITSLPHQGARADLRAEWVQRLHALHQDEELHRQLASAAAEADAAQSADEEADRGWVDVVTRARHAIRSLVDQHRAKHGDLPVWATAPLPESHINLVNRIGAAMQTGWPDLELVLQDHRALLLSRDFVNSLSALRALYLDNPVLPALAALVGEIDGSNLNTTMAAHRAEHERMARVQAWFATETWTESFQFLEQHRAELDTDEVRADLVQATTEIAGQHIAILSLTSRFSLPDVEAIITEPGAAADAALDALERGDLDLLRSVAQAAPGLRDRPLAWATVALVLSLDAGQLEQASQVVMLISTTATEVQRRALAIRLDGLRQHRPDLVGVTEALQAISDPVDTGQPMSSE